MEAGHPSLPDRPFRRPIVRAACDRSRSWPSSARSRSIRRLCGSAVSAGSAQGDPVVTAAASSPGRPPISRRRCSSRPRSSRAGTSTRSPSRPAAGADQDPARHGRRRTVCWATSRPSPPRRTRSRSRPSTTWWSRSITTRVVWHAPIELAPGVDPAELTINGSVLAQPCDANTCLPPQHFPFTAALGPGVDVAGGSGAGRGSGRRPLQPGKPSRRCSSGRVSGRADPQPDALRAAGDQSEAAVVRRAGGREPGASVRAEPLVHGRADARCSWCWPRSRPRSALPGASSSRCTWFKVTMTALVFVMALSFLGVWEIPDSRLRRQRHRPASCRRKEGAGGAFSKGVFTTILATPCTRPVPGAGVRVHAGTARLCVLPALRHRGTGDGVSRTW